MKDVRFPWPEGYSDSVILSKLFSTAMLKQVAVLPMIFTSGGGYKSHILPDLIVESNNASMGRVY